MIYEACTGHDLLDLDLAPLDFPRADLEERAHQLVDQRLSCVVREDDGTPIACFGLRRMWGGVAEGWAFFARGALERHGLAISRAARRQIAFVRSLDLFHRIQVVVKEDHHAGHHWATWLGFKPECAMRRYGYGGEDMWMYSWVPGDGL